MINQDLLRRLHGPSPLQLAAGEWAAVLESAAIIREENTGVAGMLRVLDLDGAVYVQEETPDRRILFRPRPTVEEAMIFVDSPIADLRAHVGRLRVQGGLCGAVMFRPQQDRDLQNAAENVANPRFSG